MLDSQDCSYENVSKPKEQGVEKFWDVSRIGSQIRLCGQRTIPFTSIY